MPVIPPALVGALLVVASALVPNASPYPTGSLRPGAAGAAAAAVHLGGSAGSGVTPDTVVVRFGPAGATVTQRIHPLDGRVEAHAIRLEGQDLELVSAGVAGQPATDPDLGLLPGAYHLRVAEDAPIDLRYRVTGRLDRIPLFVPSSQVQLASGPVTLRVELAPDSASTLDLGTSFPRFQRDPEGTLIASLSSIPTFLRLDASGGLSFARAADLVVVALILLAAVWAWRTARRGA